MSMSTIVFLKYFIAESSLFMKRRKKNQVSLSTRCNIFEATDKDRFMFVFNSFLNFVNHDICDMTLKLFIPVQWDEINFEEAITRTNQAEIYCNKYAQI